MGQRQPATSPYADAHSERLRQITGRYSLSEIARRTGMPVSCIHGYLNGTRIPAELFSQLVEHFGVNPVWLHTGQGAPYSTDVAPQTASMAEEVLRLVESMEAVSKMKLGAMAGDQPRVRALDESLKRHHELQERVSKRTAAILTRLVDDADKAITERKFDVAEASLATANRLRKLCTDLRLTVHIKNSEALLARLRGQVPRAVAGFREAFLNVLPVRLELGNDAHSVAFNYSNALSLMGELREAVAVADGMLILGSPEPTEARNNLDAHRGWLDVMAGNLHLGLARMARTLPLIEPLRRRRVEAPKYMIAQMYGGMLSFDAAVKGTEESPNKGALLIQLALYEEDKDRLCWLFDEYFGAPAGYIEDAKGRMSLATSLGKYMSAVVATLRDNDAQALARFDTHVTDLKAMDLPPIHYFSALVDVVQLARMAGDKTLARRRLKQARESLADMPAAMTPDLLDVARHQVNLLRLAPKDAAAAHAWRGEMVQKGYHFMHQPA